MSTFHNAPLAAVAAAFNAELKDARKRDKKAQLDVWYRGDVKDILTQHGTVHTLPGSLPVRAVSPDDFELAVTVDGYEVSWVVGAVKPYSFEIVPHGTTPNDAAVIDPATPGDVYEKDDQGVEHFENWLLLAKGIIAESLPKTAPKAPKAPKPVAEPKADEPVTLASKVKAELVVRRAAVKAAQAELDRLLAADELDTAAIKAAKLARDAAKANAEPEKVKAELETAEQPVLECAVEAPAMPALELAAAPEFTAGAAASSLVAEDLMPAPAPKGNGKGKGKNKSRTIAA
jgi:hypothetical protein